MFIDRLSLVLAGALAKTNLSPIDRCIDAMIDK
jgi:hypothetical protein